MSAACLLHTHRTTLHTIHPSCWLVLLLKLPHQVHYSTSPEPSILSSFCISVFISPFFTSSSTIVPASVSSLHISTISSCIPPPFTLLKVTHHKGSLSSFSVLPSFSVNHRILVSFPLNRIPLWGWPSLHLCPHPLTHKPDRWPMWHQPQTIDWLRSSGPSCLVNWTSLRSPQSPLPSLHPSRWQITAWTWEFPLPPWTHTHHSPPLLAQ